MLFQNRNSKELLGASFSNNKVLDYCGINLTISLL